MRILKMVLAVGVVLFFAALARADSVTITVIPTSAPNVYGSPSYNAWQDNEVYALENGLSSYGDPSLPTYYSAAPTVIPFNLNIVTGFPSWNGLANPTGTFASELGNRLLFGVDVKGNGTKISLSEMTFVMSSSDPLNLLGYSYPADTYSAGWVGISYGADGIKGTSDDSFVTSGSNTQLVDELVGRGHGNAPDAYDTDAGATLQDKIDGVVASLGTQDIVFSGTYTLNTGSSIVTGSGSVTLVPTPEPISMIFFGTGLVAVGGFMARRRMLRKA